MSSATNIKWELIIEKIKEETTILCLGADIFTHTLGGKLDDHLRQAVGQNDNVHMYDNGLFHFKDDEDLYSHYEIKKFYNQDFPDMKIMLNKIAQIRFSTIISMSPDLQLKKSFEEQGYTFQYAYHHPNNSNDDIVENTSNQPLIYNLLGDIGKRESMVLTHEDLFNFIEFSIDGKSIPVVLRKKIESAHNFIFIGLPFDKWYTQLLVRMLQKDTKKIALRYAANHAKDENTEMFYKNQFNITCVPNNINEFVTELYEHCKNADLLRAIPSEIHLSTEIDEPIPINDWLILAEAADKLESLAVFMLAHFKKNMQAEGYDSYMTCVEFNDDLKKRNNKITHKYINSEDADIEYSKIRGRILLFLKKYMIKQN